MYRYYYKSGYSLYMVDHIFNDTLIDENRNYSLLFTIPEPDSPYVQLNVFFDSVSGTVYKPYPVRARYLQSHLKASRAYSESINHAMKEPEKLVPTIDTQAVLALENKMVGRVYTFVDSLRNAFAIQSRVIKMPSDENGVLFKKTINRLIDNHIDDLRCTDGGLTSTIFVQVDTSGKVAFTTAGEKSVYDSVDSKKTNPYRRLFKKVFINDIATEKFPVYSEVLKSDPQMHVLYDNNEACKKIDSSLSLFAGTFALCRTKLHELDSVEYKSPTLYSYIFSYTSSTSEAKWKLNSKGKLTEISPSAGKVIDSELSNQFLSKLKKKRAGRYFIHKCDFEYNGGEKITSIDSVKLRYKYYTNIGVSLSTFIPVGISNNFTFNSFEFLGFDFLVTYHHIGFFIGSALYNTSSKPDITNRTNLTVIYGKPIYAQTGLYLGTCNYLYLKAGVSLLNTDRIVIDQSGASTTSLSSTYIGFTGGVSLIFPIVHIEGGFNTIFMAPYASIGLNIPLRK
jgi:hypothetical protein